MPRRRPPVRNVVAFGVVLFLLTPPWAHPQERWTPGPLYQPPRLERSGEEPWAQDASFIFCRVRYRTHRGYSTWDIDWPQSDRNFSERLAELTTLSVPRDRYGRVMHAVADLADRDSLFRYPMLYMLEVGYLTMNEEEAGNLRDYLLRGGFLLVDDFWGDDEWNNWEREIARALPPETYPIVDLPVTHEIFNIVFKLDEVPQVPSLNYWASTGRTFERWDAREPHCRGIYDEKGRLMVVILHNSDLGDGWEREGEDEAYFREFSAPKAYPLGINIVVYAMTH